jgi:hypothetical protein
MPQAKKAALVAHPAAPSAIADSVVVHVERMAAGLALRYLLVADIRRLRVPSPRAPARVEGLWRHTCFELFARSPEAPGYVEFNFSPSGEWAAYRFAGYREGGTPIDCAVPIITTRIRAEALELEVRMASIPAGARVGLSAVIEDDHGALSYWALRHPCARPDFHHADAFTLALP